jgi:hypothetical protein
MLSSYRLGDLVLVVLSADEQRELVADYPNSLGAKYIAYMNNHAYANKIEVMRDLVYSHIAENRNKFPEDITTSTVIHLRLGDVIAGNTPHEQAKRPLGVDYLQGVLSANSDKRYVIGKCFFAKPSSTNYTECIQQSDAYLQRVLSELSATHLDLGDADLDLCCGVACKTFVQGKGFFSKLIVDIRKTMGLRCIETKPEDK